MIYLDVVKPNSQIANVTVPLPVVPDRMNIPSN